ncbi:MAG: hypothetical protein ACE5L6_02085 [Candidatus Bathyarchaeia archaeon]
MDPIELFLSLAMLGTSVVTAIVAVHQIHEYMIEQARREADPFLYLFTDLPGY